MATNYLTLYNKPTYASDGSALPPTIVSVGQNANQTYTNPTVGSYTTWQTAKTGLTNVNKLAMSQTGQYQLVSGNTAGGAAVFYLSSDSGVTWTAITGIPTTVSTTGVSATLSASGQYQLIAIQGDYVYKSLDYGVTWTAVNTSPTPQVYFAFDGAATDAQGGATGVTVNNSPAYVAGAVSSSASGAIHLANSAGVAASKYISGSYTTGTSFTVSAWFNPQTFGASCMLCLGNGSNGLVQFYLNASGMFYAQMYLTGAITQAINGPILTLNTWYHFHFSYQQGGTTTLYLNGAYIGSIASTPALYQTISTFAIASLTQTNTQAFNGYIDDLRIYNSVIAPPMVKYPWNSVSMSGNASYWLAANAFGQVYRTTDLGGTWSLHTAATMPAAATPIPLQLTNSGQHQVINAPQIVVPNQTSLATYSWVNNGVTWTASASSMYSANHAYHAFNNAYGIASWASNSGYLVGGAPTGGTITTVTGVGSVSGEWIQLQASAPLVIYSYRYMSGGTASYCPLSYLIVGSLDGTTWYPIHTITMASNPLGSSGASWKNSVIVNHTGTQSIVGQGASASTVAATTTSYSTTTAPYNYFRFIVKSTSASLAEIGELYCTFVGGQAYTANSGGSWQVVPAFGDAFNVTKGITVTSAGAGYVTLPSYTYAGTGLTFSAWFYLTGAAVQYGRILDLGNSYNTPSNSFHLFTNSNGTFSAGTMINGTQQLPYLISTTACAQNTLYHICWTISAAGVQNFYVNGVSDATSVTYVPTNGTYSSNFIGKSNGANDSYPNEYIVDFRMFNRALSSAEVATLYQANNFNLGPASMEPLALSGNGKYAVGGSGQIVKVDSNYLAATLAGTQTVQSLATTGSIMCSSASYTGQYMVALTNTASANVWYSTNYGVTWTSTTVGSTALTSCAMSYDGSYIAVTSATTVYTLNLNTKGYSVAIGAQAGQVNQGLNAVAIGNKAAQVNQTANSIVVNATGSTLNTTTAGFYVAPIQTYLNGMNGALSMLAYGSDKQIVTADMYFLSQPGANYIGIGTSSPAYKLDIQNGDMSIYTNYIGYQAAGTASHMIRFRRSVHASYTDIVYGDTARIYTLRDFGYQSPGGDSLVLTTRVPTWGAETWNTGLCIGSSGSVGIGLTNPSQLLSVNGSASFAPNTITRLYASQTPQYDANWDYYASSIGNTMWNGSAWTMTSDGLNHGFSQMVYGWRDLRFCTGISSGTTKTTLTNAEMAASTRMTITSGGNVGIGLTNPSATLHVFSPYYNTVTTRPYAVNIDGSDCYNGNGSITVYAPSIRMKAPDITWVGTRVYGAEMLIDGAKSINAGQNHGDVTFKTNNSTRMIIGGDGFIKYGSGRVFCLITDTVTTFSSWFAFGSVAQANTGSCFDTSTRRFTAPVNGTYLFSFSGYTINEGHVGLAFNADFVDSSTYYATQQWSISSGYTQGTWTMYLNAGDYIKCILYNTGNLSIQRSYFTGTLLQAHT